MTGKLATLGALFLLAAGTLGCFNSAAMQQMQELFADMKFLPYRILSAERIGVDGAQGLRIVMQIMPAVIPLGGEQAEAWRILKEYSEKRYPHLRLKAAAALCALERLDQPAETGQPAAAAILQNLVTMETFAIRGGQIHHVEVFAFVTLPYGLGNG